MLSRVADSIYWMNRYMERAENVARFVDVSLYLTLDFPDPTAQAWGALVSTTGDNARYAEKYGAPTMENVLRFLTFDKDSPNSILSCLQHARDNAKQVREVISSEMWEQINKSFLLVQAAAGDPRSLEAPHGFFTAVKQASQLFVGITYLTMTHNEGWHFGRLGRLIERADKTSRIVDAKYFLLLPSPSDVGSAIDEVQWAALLKSASAFEMYRKRHGIIAPAKVIDFLLLAPRFPRSVRYCVSKACRSLEAIEGSRSESAALRLLASLDQAIRASTAESILAEGLHEYADRVQAQLNGIGEAIYQAFFSLEGGLGRSDHGGGSAPRAAHSRRGTVGRAGEAAEDESAPVLESDGDGGDA